jgi:protein TonB
VVADGGVLTNCVILSETPEGYGFGDATLKVTKMLKMAPVDSEGRSTAGQTFTSSVVWRLPTQTRP